MYAFFLCKSRLKRLRFMLLTCDLLLGLEVEATGSEGGRLSSSCNNRAIVKFECMDQLKHLRVPCAHHHQYQAVVITHLQSAPSLCVLNGLVIYHLDKVQKCTPTGLSEHTETVSSSWGPTWQSKIWQWSLPISHTNEIPVYDTCCGHLPMCGTVWMRMGGVATAVCPHQL